MGIYVRPFKKEDLAGLITIAEPEEFDGELAEAIEKSGLAATGERDGKVIMCGGVHPSEDEHGILWLKLSTDAEKHKIECLRCIKRVVEIFEKTFDFKQYDACVRCGFDKGIRLARLLGLTHIQIVDGWNIYSKKTQWRH